MAKTRLKKKSRKQLLEQIASKQGLNEVKDICEEEGILLTDAYNYIAPKETNTSEAVEKTDTVDEILAQDDLRVFSEDDTPANPLSDFKKTYQKDCFWEKVSKRYNDPFKKSNLLKRKSYEGLSEPGSAGNPYARVSTSESPVEPEVPIGGLTTKIDYVSGSNVEIPTITNTVSTEAAQMVANPPGSDTRHVTIQVGDLKVKLIRVGIGLLWEDGFEDSELSGPAIARFAEKVAANDLDTLGRAAIKLVVDGLASATAEFTVPNTGWTYRLAREAETIRKNDYLINAVVGDRTNILDLDAARATAYGGNLRPEQDAALSNVTGRVQTLNYTTDTTATGVGATSLYGYNLNETLGFVFRGQEIVITRNYEIPQKDMMARYFRRYGAPYLQPNAPIALITVP